MNILILLLASTAWGQSTTTADGFVDQMEMDRIRIQLNELQSGVPVLTSSPTYRGTIFILGTDNGVTFPDGTKQITAAAVSSSTIIPAFTTSQTSFNVAMASVTIAATGRYPIRIELSGCSKSGGSPTQAFVTFYEDAVPVGPWTSTNGVTQNISRTTSDIFNFSFSLVIRAPSNGDVIYSALHRTDGTEWIWQNDADCVGSFTASEVH